MWAAHVLYPRRDGRERQAHARVVQVAVCAFSVCVSTCVCASVCVCVCFTVSLKKADIQCGNYSMRVPVCVAGCLS